MVYGRQISKGMIVASYNVPTADGTAVRTEVLDLELLTQEERKVVRNEVIVSD